MLHPSYTELMEKVNSEVDEGEVPVVNSRYSIVLATAKRARQLIAGAKPLITPDCPKPLSIAVDELYQSKIRILSDDEAAALEEELTKKDEIEEQKARMMEEMDSSDADDEDSVSDEKAGEAASEEKEDQVTDETAE